MSEIQIALVNEDAGRVRPMWMRNGGEFIGYEYPSVDRLRIEINGKKIGYFWHRRVKTLLTEKGWL